MRERVDNSAIGECFLFLKWTKLLKKIWYKFVPCKTNKVLIIIMKEIHKTTKIQEILSVTKRKRRTRKMIQHVMAVHVMITDQ